MFIATLLTAPARPVLDRATVESLRNAWGGGDAVWLDPGIAAEIALPALPPLRLAVVEIAQGGAAHGAVNAAVEIVRRGKRTQAMAGLVNAVLRKVGEDPFAGMPRP